MASHLSAWAVRCLDAGFLQLFVASAVLMIDACRRSAFAAACEPPRLRNKLAVLSISKPGSPGPRLVFFWDCLSRCTSSRPTPPSSDEVRTLGMLTSTVAGAACGKNRAAGAIIRRRGAIVPYFDTCCRAVQQLWRQSANRATCVRRANHLPCVRRARTHYAKDYGAPPPARPGAPRGASAAAPEPLPRDEKAAPRERAGRARAGRG